MTTRPLTIAYLTSSYARATDTFIRDEVAELRRGGDRVLTFSVRRPSESGPLHQSVLEERQATTYLLDFGVAAYAGAVLRHLVRRPRRFLRAAGVAAALARPGLKGRVWPLFYFVEGCLLASLLERADVDHLHNHIGEGSASVALIASIHSGIPFSIAVHGPSEWDRPLDLALDVKTRHAAFVVTISEYTRGQLRRWVEHRDWAKVHIVRCGLPLNDYPDPASTEPSEAAEPPTLLSIGRLVPEKGHMVLMESLRGLRESGSDLRLVLVGDGPERPRLERFVADNGLEPAVELVGWKSSVEVRELMRASAALVMPSFAEGLPVVIMEAFASGIPVISSDVGGISELVVPGASGWLVAPGSVAELTSAIGDLLSAGAARRRAMGSQGRESVLARHSLQSEVSKLRELIHAQASDH